MFSEEAPGVFSVASRFVDGKNGVVIGDRIALAIDGSQSASELHQTIQHQEVVTGTALFMSTICE